MHRTAKFAILIILLLLISCSFIIDLFGQIRPQELRAVSEKDPIVLARQSDHLSTEIRQIVSDEEHLYVLFGPYGIVQAYTLDGTYLYSISVYNHVNGRIEIATKDNYLYICDKIQNLYVFSGKDFTAFIDRAESAAIRKQLPLGISDTHYSMQGASLWRDWGTPEAQCVLQRSNWLVIYQGNISWLIKFTLLITAGVILCIPIPFKKEDSTSHTL